MSELNRRQFVILSAATGAAACACAGVGAQVFAADPPLPRGPVDVGALKDLTAGGEDAIVDRFARSNRVLLVRRGDRLYAPTATCSHKGCAIKAVNGEIRCPCHGARYRVDGTVAKGPARDSLTRYAISVNGDGHVIVDTSQKFGEKQWDEPGTFVKLT
jgi:nitrite reductase/ring-hydroxylating ferredoxin subunit